MAQTRRSMIASALVVFVTMSLTLGTVFAAELLGTLKSVDADAKKIVVTEKGTDKDVEVTIKDDTEWVSPKGKTIAKYDLAKAKKGMELEITHEGAVASKVVIKKGVAKKKEFSGN